MAKIKSLIYCTKAKPYLYDKLVIKSEKRFSVANNLLCDYFLNGKIVAECDCETEGIEDKVSFTDSWFNEGHHTKTLSNKELEKRSCLSYQDLIKYLGDGEPNEVIGYALHISNLKIFDTPKELNDYCLHEIVDHIFFNEKEIKKAPQNMCRVYDKKLTRTEKGDGYVLISIRPEWLCKILNGEKTIEVRKKILKGMVE